MARLSSKQKLPINTQQHEQRHQNELNESRPTVPAVEAAAALLVVIALTGESFHKLIPVALIDSFILTQQNTDVHTNSGGRCL